MFECFDIYASPQRVGDFLNLTALMNAVSARLILEDTEDNCRVSVLGEGLGPVEFLPQLPRHTEWECPGRGTAIFARRLLDRFGFKNVSSLPKIKLTEEEIVGGRALVGHISNPVAIRDIQGYGVERNPPSGLMQRIVDSNPECTFVSFGISSHHSSLPYQMSTLRNVVVLDDLPLRMVAACYAAIGRYVGVDTGNYHLMLSVGGKCDVWCPKDNTIGYNHWALWYPERDREDRLNYIGWTDPSPRSIIGLRYM